MSPPWCHADSQGGVGVRRMTACRLGPEPRPITTLGLWLTRSVPRVVILRYVFTPLDRAALGVSGGRLSLAPKVIPSCS